MKITSKLAAMVSLCSLVIGTVPAQASSLPEKLNYELTWNRINIGHSSIETTLNGDVLDIVSSVHSASWSAPFYKVDDIETSKLKRVGKYFALSSYKLKLLEGKNNWYRAVSVDHKDKRIRFADLMTYEKKTEKLVGAPLDPVSSLYFLRQQPLVVGKPIYLDVVDKGKVNHIRVNVLRKETVKTPAGTFKTVVISPEMSIESQGLFYAEGPTTIWLTDDSSRVPVIIQKRIDNLFRNGVPPYLRGVMPDLNQKNLGKLETIRAELVNGKW